MKKRLIITGHDLGYSASVNAGFAYLLSQPNKLFSELSILPNSKYSHEAVTIAVKSRLPTNLAFCLINAKMHSLSGARSLVGLDNFLKDVPNIKTWDFSVVDSFTPEDIEQELNAQYQWFLDSFGRKPSALVTQKGEHGDPKILEPMIRLAKKEGLPIRAPWWKWQTNYAAQSLVEFEGIKTTGQIIVAFKDWQNMSGWDLEDDFEAILAKIHASSGVSELALLPGFCDQELYAMTSLSWQRGRIISLFERKYSLIKRIYQEFDVISYQDL